jgi:hypothetical protein
MYLKTPGEFPGTFLVPMVLCTRVPAPGYPGTRECIHENTFPNAEITWYPWFRVPWYSGTRVPRYLNNSTSFPVPHLINPNYPGTQVPRYQVMGWVEGITTIRILLCF